MKIILMGPFGSGKSTVTKLISERLGWNYYSLDEESSKYLRKMPNSSDIANKINSSSIHSPERQEYNIYFLAKFLEEYGQSFEPNCVLELGAGHPVYYKPEYKKQAYNLLSPYSCIIFIAPSENLEESTDLIVNQVQNNPNKRGRFNDDKIREMYRTFLENSSYQELSKYKIYTKNKTPEEVCNEICLLLGL